MTATLTAISVRELHERTAEVLDRLREEGQAVEIVDGDVVIARISPVTAEEQRVREEERRAREEWWAEFKRLGEEISKRWPAGVSAEEAVSEQRRDL